MSALPPSGSLRGMVRQLSIDQFENESRRVSLGPDSAAKAQLSPMFEKPPNEPCVSKVRTRAQGGRTCVRPMRGGVGARAGQVRRTQTTATPSFPQTIIKELLHPRTWKPPEDRSFFLDAEQINELCDVAERIFRDEPSVLQLQGEGGLLGGVKRDRRTRPAGLRRTPTGAQMCAPRCGAHTGANQGARAPRHTRATHAAPHHPNQRRTRPASLRP